MSKIIKIDVKSPYVTSVFVGTTVAPNDTRTDGPYNVATFAAAVYCSFDNDGNMYVTDSTSTTGYLVPSFIRKVDREGNVTTVLTSTDIKFQSVEVDNTGQLILASYGSRYIYRRFNNTAVTSLEFFDNPNAVVSDLFGNLFVVDTGAHSLYWIDTQNTVRLLAGTPSTPGYKDQNSTTGPIALFNNPRCIAFDSKGVLYLVEQSNRAVRQITWTS